MWFTFYRRGSGEKTDEIGELRKMVLELSKNVADLAKQKYRSSSSIVEVKPVGKHRDFMVEQVGGARMAREGFYQ